MKILDIVSAVLLIIGGLAWGIFGLFEFNFVEFFFKSSEEFHVHHHPSVIARIIYILVGASAVYQIIQRKGMIARWKQD